MSLRQGSDTNAKADAKSVKKRKRIKDVEDDDDSDASGRKQRVWDFKIPKKASKSPESEASDVDPLKDEISPPTSDPRRPTYNQKPARRSLPMQQLKVNDQKTYSYLLFTAEDKLEMSFFEQEMIISRDCVKCHARTKYVPGIP